MGTWIKHTSTLKISHCINNIQLYKVSPSEGVPGDTVTLSGNNFVPHRLMKCRFGLTKVNALWISNTQASCTIPNIPYMDIELSISNYDVTYSTPLLVKVIDPKKKK